MIRLLILADDFTGALDSGVQLSKTGAVTHVVTDLNVCFDAFEQETDVLIVDTETRHLPPDMAYQIIRDITMRAMASGINVIYKKTDSALRGNIGAELDAVLEGSGAEKLYFVPAFPKLGRSTRDGVHYFYGVPIHETVFGKDPFKPVQASYIPDIIRQQTEIPVTLVCEGEEIPDKSGYKKEIILFDASSDGALSTIADHFYRTRRINILAGCAGFAAYLPHILDLQRPVHPVCVSTPGILVVSGSLNPITSKQLDIAKKAGFDCTLLTTDQKLYGIPETEEGNEFLNEIIKKYSKSRCLLIASSMEDGIKNMEADSFEKESDTVAMNMGNLVRRLFDKGLRGTVVVTGGDTLREVLNSFDCMDIKPLCEIETGVVLSQANIADGNLMVVSKSGGIGTDEVFVRVAEYLDIELPCTAMASE